MEIIVSRIREIIKSEFEGETTGHDWWHLDRVVTNALRIAEKEGGDAGLIELAALLHDVGDHKFYKEENAQEVMVRKMLIEAGAEESLVLKVLEIISQVSFKGNKTKQQLTSIEAMIVQDADRLDALGAVGIARAFAYGGSKNRMIYDPGVAPKDFKDAKSYTNDNGHTINHFYEKLLLLKDIMQTETGKKMAAKRHLYMEGFLKEFYKEWGMMQSETE